MILITIKLLVITNSFYFLNIAAARKNVSQFGSFRDLKIDLTIDKCRFGNGNITERNVNQYGILLKINNEIEP